MLFFVSAVGYTFAGMMMGFALSLWLYLSKADSKKDKDRSLTTTTTSRSGKVSSWDHESFLTGLVCQLWENINEAVCQSVRESVEPSFKDLPRPLNSMRFTKLHLGTVPLRLDNIVVHEKANDVIQFDVDVVWDGDCEIELKANLIGRLGVRTLKFNGRMAFILKPLSNILPCIGAVQYCFIDQPNLSIDFTGLAEVVDIGVVKKQVEKIIDDTLSGMLVLPNRMITKLDPALSFFDIYQPPVCVVRIRLLRGSSFAVEKRTMRKDDVQDVYCNISVSNSKVWKSSIVKDSSDPVWGKDEFADFLLYDYCQSVTVHAFDEDNGFNDSDDELGSATVSVQKIVLSAGNRTLKLPMFDISGKDTGSSITVQCDLLPLTSSTESFNLQKASTNTIGGVVTVLINKAFDVPAETSSFVKISFGTDQEFQTATVAPTEGVDAINPCFDGAFHIPITTDKFLTGEALRDVKLELYKVGEEEPELLGKTIVSRSDYVDAPNSTLTTKKSLEGSPASLEFRISVQGLDLKGSDLESRLGEANLDGEPAPVQKPTQMTTIRVTAISGRGFKIQKTRLRKTDVPDVYAVFNVGSNPPWTTSVVKNNTTPEWHEHAAFLIAQDSDTINLTAFDSDKESTDDGAPLGSAKVTVAKLLLAGGKMEVELEQDGEATGAFMTISCEKAGTVDMPALNDTTLDPVKKTTDEPEVERSSSPAVDDDSKTGAFSEALADDEPSSKTDIGNVRLTAVKGRGFKIERRRMKKDDVPDVYLVINVGSSNKPFKTSVVKDSLEPVFDESSVFWVSADGDMVSVEAFDRDTGKLDKDDFLGSMKVPISKLLTTTDEIELELEIDEKPIGSFVTLQCDKLGA